jgi:hypothetical protein
MWITSYSSGSQPGVHEKLTGGMQNLENNSKEAYLGIMFHLGVPKRDTILIWEYAEGYNFDLGIRKYQKVENPWSWSFKF